MPALVNGYSFKSNPFEFYVAENEPEIDEYAVRPPYFHEVMNRALRPSTFILFGYRGSGKSATRLTVTKDIWAKVKKGEVAPLPVPLVDFNAIMAGRKIDAVTSSDFIAHIAFLSVEALLLWLSSLDDADVYIEALDESELSLVRYLINEFYIVRPEAERKLSEQQAMRLLQQNFANRSVLWLQRKWDAISTITSALTGALLRKKAGCADLKDEVKSLLHTERAVEAGATLLFKLGKMASIFGFSGIAIFVDKVDEHPQTQHSAEASARLVYPLLAHVQLLEVEGVGWLFFLWDKMRSVFKEQDHLVRLDKIAFGEVAWTDANLTTMIDKRIAHFSANKTLSGLVDICEAGIDIREATKEMASTAMRSPRELIRLSNVMVREHDVLYADQIYPVPLKIVSFELGQDAYVRDILWNLYEPKLLSQIVRLGLMSFTNKDVQSTFKIHQNSARGRVQAWENAGAIRLSGQRMADGDGGGKPSNEYSISDQRIIRMIERKLYDASMLLEQEVESAD